MGRPFRRWYTHPGRMLRVHFSNRVEALVEGLVTEIDRVRGDGSDALEPVHIVVPNRNMERYVELAVAQALGAAANLSFHRLERFVRQWLEGVLPDHRILDRTALETSVLRVLLSDDIEDPALRPVAQYLRVAGDDPDSIDLRRVQLAVRIAGLFEEYAFSRPELLDTWSAGRSALHAGRYEAAERWQRHLWQRVRGRPPQGADASWLAFHEALQRLDRTEQAGPVETQVHVFGISYVARVFQWAFASLGERTELHLYALNPCMEFWEDVPSASELRPKTDLARRRDRLPASTLAEREHHPRLGAPADTPPLMMWGRPGREHVHGLNDLSGCDFDARFRDPVDEMGPSLLTRLQQDILRLEPERRRPDPDLAVSSDGSVQVLACPGVRREVETIADEIWSLVGHSHEGAAHGTQALRFNDIAVLVPGGDRGLYIPHIEAVFREARGIPHNIVDLPLASGSRLAEAAEALLDLPFSRLTRADVLDVITHPAVRGRVPELDPGEWIRVIDRLGVFHGIDHGEHRDTYVERDIHNWDQGIRRLVLGAFMTGERGGDERMYELGGEQYLPEEGGDEAAELGLIVRSLLNDVRFARTARLPLEQWADFFSGLFQGYLTPSEPAEQTDLRRCLAAAQSLADRDLGEERVGYRVAAELTRAAVQELGGARGEYLADGVVVSTLVPMRAIPFGVVFVAGLGEGKFPVHERRDTMDLRNARRRTGDVTPAERDEYTFLESLLSARRRFYLSYVARDELTGDPVEPSPVLRQLLDVIERGYVPGASGQLVRTLPLRRYDPEGESETPCCDLPEAHAEARARRVGRALRGQVGQGEADRTTAAGDPARRLARLEAALGADWQPVRELLCLCPRPRVEPTAEPEDQRLSSAPAILRLSLSTLRRFLESPLQGWAQAIVGIEEDDPQAPEAREEEPFAAPAMEATLALRRAFIEAARGEGGAEARYGEAVARLEARGRWPTGLLRELRREQDARILTAWRTQLDRVLQASGGGTPERLRFGPGLEHGDADRLLDAIPIEIDDPRPERAGCPLRVELTGRTQPLLRGPEGSLIPIRRGAGGGERDRAEQFRYALRGFVDHVALTATEGRTRTRHPVYVLYGDDPGQAPGLELGRLDPGTALDWLRERVGELIGETHAYNLPCEALLRKADRWEAIDAEELAQSIHYVRDRWTGGQSRFGPVPDAGRYEPPPPDRALEIATRRFALFFQLLRTEAR